MNNVILQENGIDYAAGLRRFLEDRELYEEMLTAFLSDDSFQKASEAFCRKDYSALFDQAHALKGASGNLDMPELYRASGELTEFLRHNRAPEAARVSELFYDMQAAYSQVAHALRAASK